MVKVSVCQFIDHEIDCHNSTSMDVDSQIYRLNLVNKLLSSAAQDCISSVLLSLLTTNNFFINSSCNGLPTFQKSNLIIFEFAER